LIGLRTEIRVQRTGDRKIPAVTKRSVRAKPRTSAVAPFDKLRAMADSSRRDASGEEDLEDRRDLERAIVENGSKPLVPWEKVKKELGLG